MHRQGRGIRVQRRWAKLVAGVPGSLWHRVYRIANPDDCRAARDAGIPLKPAACWSPHWAALTPRYIFSGLAPWAELLPSPPSRLLGRHLCLNLSGDGSGAVDAIIEHEGVLRREDRRFWRRFMWINRVRVAYFEEDQLKDVRFQPSSLLLCIPVWVAGREIRKTLNRLKNIRKITLNLLKKERDKKRRKAQCRIFP